MYTSIFDGVPNMATIILGITAWSAPFFLALLPYLFITFGIMLAALFAKWFSQLILSKLGELAIWLLTTHKPLQAMTTSTGAMANILAQPTTISHPNYLHTTKKKTEDSY